MRQRVPRSSTPRISCDPDTVPSVKKKQKETVLAKVHSASTEVNDAVIALDKLLSELLTTPRAQKTTISKVVQEAFSRLKTARVALVDVEKILKKEKEE